MAGQFEQFDPRKMQVGRYEPPEKIEKKQIIETGRGFVGAHAWSKTADNNFRHEAVGNPGESNLGFWRPFLCDPDGSLYVNVRKIMGLSQLRFYYQSPTDNQPPASTNKILMTQPLPAGASGNNWTSAVLPIADAEFFNHTWYLNMSYPYTLTDIPEIYMYFDIQGGAGPTWDISSNTIDIGIRKFDGSETVLKTEDTGFTPSGAGNVIYKRMFSAIEINQDFSDGYLFLRHRMSGSQSNVGFYTLRFFHTVNSYVDTQILTNWR